MEKRKRILLTGASGTVGYEVLKQLCEAKDRYEVTVFDLKSKAAVRKFAPFQNQVTLVWGSISNATDLLPACHNQDVVIHLAAIIPPLADDQPALSHQVNAVGTETLIRLLEQHSSNAFLLYSSSISVYGDRLHTPLISVGDALQPSAGDEYAKTKILAEQYVQSSKLDWSIFRLAAIMGGHKVSKLMFHQPLKTSLEIASPADTARAFVNAIEKQTALSRRTFNLGGGENCRMLYEDFLARNFEIFGLGKLNFAPKSFAEKNFHCGYYADGQVLNDIVHFRRDSLEDYFEGERKKVSAGKKRLASLLQKPIKNYLQKQSEPLAAFRKGDAEGIAHYFEAEE